MSSQHFHDELVAHLASIQQLGPNEPVWQQVAALCQGGQHLRPDLIRLLVLGNQPDTVLSAELVRDAAALELVHCSTLIHDDIIDKGEMRRGLPTVNAAFGAEIALLVGNLVKDHALTIASPAVVSILNSASRDVNLGQLKETQARQCSRLSMSDYFAISLYKAGRIFRYCVRLAAQHGADVDAGVEDVFELIGMLYQAVDDWLDLFNSTAVTGKTAGRDIENNVHSFVYTEWSRGICLADLPLPESQKNLLEFSAAVRTCCLTILDATTSPAAAIAAGYLDRIDRKIRQLKP